MLINVSFPPHQDYARAMAWLHRHQHPKKETDCESDNIVELSHPLSDGDGFATRAARLMGRALPHILSGKVVVLKGGWRGYTSAPMCKGKGYECMFRPFSRCSLEGTLRRDIPNSHKNSFEKKTARKKDIDRLMPPKDLLKRGRGWWLGILLNFFLRPNKRVQALVSQRAKELGITKSDNYVSMHVRKGDKMNSHGHSFEKYAHVSEFNLSISIYVNNE